MQLYSRGLATLRLPVVVLLAESPDYALPMARISEAVNVGVATLSESSRTWERGGVVTRITPVSDARSTTLRLTAAGLDDYNLFKSINTPAS